MKHSFITISSSLVREKAKKTLININEERLRLAKETINNNRGRTGWPWNRRDETDEETENRIRSTFAGDIDFLFIGIERQDHEIICNQLIGMCDLADEINLSRGDYNAIDWN